MKATRLSRRWLPILLLVAAACQAQRQFPADITVAADGSGNFKSVEQAVQSIPADNHQRVVILIRDGVYKEKVRIDAPFVTLRGQSRQGTRIEYPQLNTDFNDHPDDIGRAVVNINSDDVVLQNLTIDNTAGVVGPHAVALFGLGDRTVTVDCDILSDGADTVSLWRGQDGRYYHARCNFRGAIDSVCPRGWCYAVGCNFFETNKAACIWHDGSLNRDMKVVLRSCSFDGVDGWYLGRHRHDAQFYLLDCLFSKSMIDRPIRRYRYPVDGGMPTKADKRLNRELDKSNQWGEREYFWNCHRDGGDYAWLADNLPLPEEQITPAWTFGGTWDPENSAGPLIQSALVRGGQVAVTFSQCVTVRGNPRVELSDGAVAPYVSGSGRETLLFAIPQKSAGRPESVEANGGWIIATEASAMLRCAQLGQISASAER